MMQMPPGIMQMLASMALTNPDKLAMMAAAKGIQPPEGGALPMAPGPTSGMSPTQMINPSAAPMAGGQTSVAVPQPEAPGPTPQEMAAAAQSGIGALAPPSAASGGGGGGNAPSPFIPGALASQMPQIMAMLMAGGGGQIPGIGAQILGR